MKMVNSQPHNSTRMRASPRPMPSFTATNPGISDFLKYRATVLILPRIHHIGRNMSLRLGNVKAFSGMRNWQEL